LQNASSGPDRTNNLRHRGLLPQIRSLTRLVVNAFDKALLPTETVQ
jgi:hypothetical protein